MSILFDVTTRRLSLDPRAPAFYHDPYAAYAAVLAQSPVAFWEELGCWCFFGFEEVNRLLRDRRFGREILHVATREELGWPPPRPHTRHFDHVDAHSLLEREPPVHTRLRGLVNRAFVSRRVDALRPAIESMAHDLIDAFPAGPFDLIARYATPIPVRIIARLLGVPTDMAPQLLAWSHDMVAMYGVARTYEVETRADAAAAAFSHYIRHLVAERRSTLGDDLLSVLIAAEEQGERLSEAELVSTAILLLNAGHEATVHALGNAVHAVLNHGVRMPDIIDDDAAMARLVEEALRFVPPLHLFKRYVLTDTIECGISLRRGEQIALVLGATGRDPRLHEAPDMLLPQRAQPQHTSFGAGIHYCVGAPLARLELQCALRVLFRRCPNLTLAGAPLPKDSWHFHGLRDLYVQV
jgi:unspecific monooxygenase